MTCVLGAKIAERNVANGIPNTGIITVSGATAGVILIIIGLVNTFFGRKALRLTLFLAGFTFVSAAILVVLYQIKQPTADETTRALLYLICSMVFGILGGVVSLWLFKLGVFFVGALGGLAVSSYILTWSSIGLFKDQWAQILFVVIFALAFGLIAMFFEKYIVIISTAIFGAYILYIGIDCFALTGFKEATFSVFSDVARVSNQDGKIYGMLAGASVTAILGMIVQLKTNNGFSK